MRFLRLLLALGALLAALGCQPPATSSSSGGSAATPANRLDAIIERGALRLGLSGNQPPLNMRNREGEIIGLEVELVGELADSMGLDVEVVPMPFADLLGALEDGTVDLVASGMTITPERNARVAFAGPYVISGKSFLTKDEEILLALDEEELNLEGRRYAALRGSTSEIFVRRNLAASEAVPTQDYDAAVQMVIAGEVDALIADFPICAVSILRYPEENLGMLYQPLTVEPLGIALPADDPLFVNLVQNYLATLDETGFLVSLKAKWFNDGDWLDELP